jgi:integrase
VSASHAHGPKSVSPWIAARVLTDANPMAVARSPYMFTGRTGQPLRPDNVTSRFNKLALAAGVRPIGPHQIRHLLASSLLDAGYGIHEVAERLGHDPGTLMRYYTRVSAARRRQATEDIAGLLFPPVSGIDREISA